MNRGALIALDIRDVFEESNDHREDGHEGACEQQRERQRRLTVQGPRACESACVTKACAQASASQRAAVLHQHAPVQNGSHHVKVEAKLYGKRAHAKNAGGGQERRALPAHERHVCRVEQAENQAAECQRRCASASETIRCIGLHYPPENKRGHQRRRVGEVTCRKQRVGRSALRQATGCVHAICTHRAQAQRRRKARPASGRARS